MVSHSGLPHLAELGLAHEETRVSRSSRDGAYVSSREHILAELERIDLLIEAQVRRARQSHKENELQGLYISEREVDAILAQPIGLPSWAAVPPVGAEAEVAAAIRRLRAIIETRTQASRNTGVLLRLVKLAECFGLDAFEVDTILLCLAAELDLRYEKLYAYLQDDVTKKRISIDLALNLLSTSFAQKLSARSKFSSSSRVSRHQLVSIISDPSTPGPSLLNLCLKLDERVVNYLLDGDEIDARLEPVVSLVQPDNKLDDLILPDDLAGRLELLVSGFSREGRGFNLCFQGPYGAGKRSTAGAICKSLGLKLLIVDSSRAASAGGEFGNLVRLISREALLQEAAIYWHNFDVLLADDRRTFLEVVHQELSSSQSITFFGAEAIWEPADVPQRTPLIRIALPRPGYSDRVAFWEKSLAAVATDVDTSALANKFRFTGGQIRDAAATARNLALRRDPTGASLDIPDLLEACRLQSNRKLASLATQITPHYSWPDIVLAPERLRQLREVCNALEYRSLVYDEWGFDKKLSLGKGLSLLFTGPSGTGKTMAAQILAGEMGVDLYKIDLSTVISKYIGETEKNLARIFAEAVTSNAVLFFDEADALFGKRSEVRDSHDRYANIEINYLLQRMEEYEGTVILATNLRKNMDEAFVRRIQFTIEFPFPNTEQRLAIWQKTMPDSMPRKNLDLELMAKRFELAGGSIRNIVLSAAFLGAEDGRCVTMEHLLRATRQEYQKMGKVVTQGEFERPQANEHGPEYKS
jgi:ATP-dependent 26S proteasome regulatory subunit